MSDITILYITASEMPESWTKFQLEHLLRAANGAPIVSVSRKPLDLGTNLLDTEEKCYWNIYRQLRRAAEVATTPFVAMAEDDTLYTREHFYSFRPQPNEVAYDHSRWSLFAWDPIFCLRQRVSNCSLVASRIYLINALLEREAKHPNGLPNEKTGEVGRKEHVIGVSPRNMVEWYSRGPIVQLNHTTGTDQGDYGVDKHGRHLIKAHGQIQAIEIPYWGKAKDIVKHYAPN